MTLQQPSADQVHPAYFRYSLLLVVVCLFVGAELGRAQDFVNPVDGPPLPGTKKLTLSGDIASEIVDSVDRFLLREIELSVDRRAGHWKRDTSSARKYSDSIEPNRQRLAHIIGVRDDRVPFDTPDLVATTEQSALVSRGEGYQVFAVRWPAFGDVSGEGLLLVPTGDAPVADIVAIPDADQTPEMIVGLTEGVPAESQFARRLAESGCRVLVPVLIDRKIQRHRSAQLTNREFLYRSAFELGRHLIGYEVQKVLAGVDWFTNEAGQEGARIGVIGWGEGGLIALYAAALDTRIDAACVSGYFDSRQNVWQEPLDRNVFGLLEQFGDAELASMIAPRALIVEAARGPEVVVPPKLGGGPGRLVTPKLEDVDREFRRAGQLTAGGSGDVGRSPDTDVGRSPDPPTDRTPISHAKLVTSGDGSGPFGSEPVLRTLLDSLSPGAAVAPLGETPSNLRKQFATEVRQARQIYEIVRHNEWLLGESPYVRKEFFKQLKLSSLEEYGKGIEWYRKFFYDEVIGRFGYDLSPFNVRSRTAYDEAKWTGYEVMMDVFPDVPAYGFLLLPKGIKPGEQRPVVVCQVGLGGRPRRAFTGDSGAYHFYGARLAELGFIVFAPQPLYCAAFGDRFRTLQRKANPIKKTLFSLMVPQHQQITDWLKSLPQVDGQRIGFYGLSYGGKSAMRVPPLVSNYSLSICSGDFNDWVWKNASTCPHQSYSYVWHGEYEIFEFDLGSTFNYAEMAALIAPRPFMVERGHFDGVGSDEAVGYEFAKVRHLYQARLGIGDRCEIEWFSGPHEIHAHGTFDFLQKHLDWPKPPEPSTNP